MKKRLIAMILCVAMLLTMDLYIRPVVAEEASPKTEPDVVITLDGTELHELVLPSDEKRVLTAAVQGFTAANYQWQILMQGPSSVWVNIYDKTEAACEISEVVLREMLDETNAAFVRCRVSDEEGSLYYSDTLGVLITEPQESEPADPLLQPINEVSAAFRSARTMPLAATEYVSVTIKYLDFSAFKESGIESAIYSPYVATIEKGSDFTQTVVSPTFLGFAPFYDLSGADNVDDIKTDATQVSVDKQNLTEDVVIRVFYKPIEVNFAVRYFFQNVGDDLYTENVALYHTDKAETGTIISDKYLLEQAGSIEGFSMMYHIPESVAADGSTVFECYFDRQYYLLRFDMDGGYGVEPIYARYGTTFIVNDPVKHGYEFQGWDLLTADTNADGVLDKGDGVADELPNTIPNEPRFYKAIWSTVNTTYTVVYWAENPDDTNFSYWGYAKHNATSATYVSGDDTAATDFMPDAEHFEFQAALSDKNVFVEGDGTSVVNVYYTRKFYTITFKNTSDSCKIPTGHTHSEAEGCYDYICEATIHTHDASCLVCTTPAHTHNAGCCSIPYHVHDASCCIITPHTHGSDCCTITPHTHSTACYSSSELTLAANATGNAKSAYDEVFSEITAPVDGYIYKYSYQTGNWWERTNYNFFYLGGVWYYLGEGSNYSNVTFSGTFQNPEWYSEEYTTSKAANLQCGQTEHTHGGSGCSCSETEHIHGTGSCVGTDAVHDHSSGCNNEACPYGGAEHVHEDACYSCSFGAHEHTDACKRLICPIPENHTHSNTCRRNRVLYYIHAKFEQSLNDEWPLTDYGGVVYDDGQRWDPSGSSYFEEVLVFIATMPDEDFTLTLNTSTNSTKTMYYYLEILPPEGREPVLGEDYDVEYLGVKYKSYLHEADGSVKPIKANYGYMTEAEDFFDIAGFTKYASDPAFSGGQISKSTANFYYKRSIEGKLQFSSSGVVSDHPASGHIKYGEKLKPYNYVPSYPDNLEPNAYYFAGWYTSPGCFDGTEADWETLTMPADGILLYAKWAPTTHKVNFFTTLDDMNAYEDDPASLTPYKIFDAIEHGNIVGSVENPVRDGDGGLGLVFGGWFYIDAGQKRAFEPLAMPINRDINVFADWSSFLPQPYRIDYVLMDDRDVAVADPSMSFAYAGSTRTFQAKAGAPYNQLFDEYNEGYFPTIASHSITMQYEEDKEHPVHNVHTFYYVEASNIEYTVRYVNKVTGVEMGFKTMTTSQAVVTERFVAYPDMVPDAFYKRLVISVELDPDTGKYVGTDDNEIIFYYMPNDTSAFYAVHFMLEKLHAPSLSPEKIAELQNNYAIDGSGGYEETPNTHLEGTGTIGDIESINPLVFPGFELITDKAVTVTGADGVPVSAPYKTDHYEIEVSADGTELYIFYSRKQFNYQVHYYKYNTTEPVDPDIAPTETHTGFYNSTVSADAKVVGGYTCVSATHQELLIRQEEAQNVIVFYYAPVQYVVEYILVPPEGGWLSNTIEVKTGNEDFEGATPNVSEFYEFVGWFTDAACTVSVPPDMCTFDSNTNHLLPIKAALSETESNKFYAKLVPKGGNLTITRSDATDPEQVFVYEILNNTTGEVINVTVVGNGSVTVKLLQFGEYTVTQKNEWSWRYGDSASSVTHNTAAGTTVLFKAPPVDDQWLHDNSELILNQKGDTT